MKRHATTLNVIAVVLGLPSGLCGRTADAAVNVAETTADLVGTLNASGSVFTVRAYYGTNGMDTNAAAWLSDPSASSIVVGTFTNVSEFSVTGSVSALTGETTYYYTMAASNAVTNIWATPNAAFTTRLLESDPPIIVAVNPTNMQTGVIEKSDLVATFDEGVYLIGGGVMETSPGVFTVEVTPTRPGLLQLQVRAGASLDDSSGNLLDTTSAILDDTIVTVDYGRPLFTEDFEVPDTPTAYSQGTTPVAWVRASQGYRASYHGITDKAGGDFSAPDPNHQAYAFRYTNSGFTTDEGVIAALMDGVTYTVVFRVVRDDGGNAGTPYSAQLIAFAPGAARNDCRSTPAGSKILASAGGNAPPDGTFKRVSFRVSGDAVAHAAYMGYDLGVRFLGATTSAIIDNLAVYDDQVTAVPGTVLIVR